MLQKGIIPQIGCAGLINSYCKCLVSAVIFFFCLTEFTLSGLKVVFFKVTFIQKPSVNYSLSCLVLFG